MQQGQKVGLVARGRFPGGGVGRVPDSYPLSIEKTEKLINEGSPIVYEAAFQAAGVRVVVDVLVRGQAGWRLIEVKSSTRVKPEHLWDVAVQAYVLKTAGLALEDICLLHVNTDYVREGELDHQAMFTETSVVEEVESLAGEVERVIAQSRATLASKSIPPVPIGRQCTDPNACDFKAYCWKGLPSPSVFDIYYIGKKAYTLYDQGVECIEDIPAEYPLDKRSRFHIQAHTSGEVIVNQGLIQDFLRDLHYPLHYLDFETWALAIPPFDGISPYEKVPFQYSLHIQSQPGEALEHYGYLAEAGKDPRTDFLDRLIKDTAGTGSIVVYNQSFEKGVLCLLRGVVPAYQVEIGDRIQRMVDLLVPFRQRAYWHPDMGGSNSLKAVLPVFAPDLSYDTMDIGDGQTAMVEFLNLFDEADPERIESVRQSLWDYCCLDTLAMARIVGGLRTIVQA